MLHGNTKKLLFCSLSFFANASCMEIDVSIKQDNAARVPTLYSLCKKQAAIGDGKSRNDRKKNAFESVQAFSKMVDGDLAKDVQRSFLRHWLYNEGHCVSTVLVENCSPLTLMKKGKQLYGLADKNLFIWDFASTDHGNVIVENRRQINGDGFTFSCGLVSKKRPLLYLGTHDNKIIVLDAMNQALIQVLPMLPIYAKINRLAENDKGDLFSTQLNMGNINVWDVGSVRLKEVIVSPQWHKVISSLVVDKDMIYAGGYYYVQHDSRGIIDIYDVRAGEYTHVVNAHHCNIRCLLKSKQDTDFYSAAMDGTIKVWDIRNVKTCKRECAGPLSAVSCLQEGAEGCLLASGWDGLKVWDMAADKPYVINKLTDDYLYYDMVHDSDEAKIYISTKTEVKVLSSGCIFDRIDEKDEK